MRPTRHPISNALRRSRRYAWIGCPAVLLGLGSLYVTAQPPSREVAEPRLLEVAPLAAPIGAADRADAPEHFSAQLVQHQHTARHDADVPSYLRHGDQVIEKIDRPAAENSPGGRYGAAPKVIYEHSVVDRPSIPVPLMRPESVQPTVRPQSLPTADALPSLPGGPSSLPGGPSLQPAQGRPEDGPRYSHVPDNHTQGAAISPYPAVRGEARPKPAATAPRDVYTQAKPPEPAQPKPGPQPTEVRRPEPPAASPATQQARMISSQADGHVRAAFSLAERGALYSARAELIQALRLVTQSLDAAQSTNEHGEALAAGLRALRESEDFIPRGTQLEADSDLAALITSHRTPVLKEVAADPQKLETLTPMVAVQSYLLYAQQQLTAACDGAPAGSLSLYALGRLHMAMADLSAEAPQRKHPQAMTLYQAAVATDQNNFLAANELGVMLARYGRHEAAKQMLQLASRGKPRAETWHNLSAVHQQLGEQQLAALARQEFEAAKARQNGTLRFAAHNGLSPPVVEWVSPEAFAEQSRGAALPPAAPRPSKPATAKSAQPPEKSPGATSWLTPWSTRNR